MLEREQAVDVVSKLSKLINATETEGAENGITEKDLPF